MLMNPSEFNLNLAVVIGINDYHNGIPSLGTAKQDAEAIAAILENDYNYQVHLLTDSQATGQALKNWLETELPQQLEKVNPSRLVFYFAGHGIALNGDDGPQGYLIPQNAKLGDAATYLPMQQVETALTKLSCRHCLVILDCCFAGAFRWSSTRKLVAISETIHKERFDRFIKDSAWQVITSAASDQFALDNLDLNSDRRIAKENSNHSPFAAALMEALRGEADAYPPAKNGQPPGDGIITATELYLYLRDAVEVPTDARNQRQTPQIWCLKKHDKGEFIFLPPGHELNLPPAPTLDNLEENNPYRGLKSYETKDSELFFGRTSLIEKLCYTVSDRPLTVVLGASGSGKSSLVKAGLIPYLPEFFELSFVKSVIRTLTYLRVFPSIFLLFQSLPLNRVYQWHSLSPIRPGESPLNSLNSVLKELGNVTTEQVNSQIFTETITVWSKANPQTKLLLVVDQLEELITLCRNDEEKQQFLDILATLINTFPDVVRLVVTLRSDFEPQLRNTPLEPLWQAGRFVVPAMTREELRSVIEEPASAKVVYFESLDNPDKGYLVDRLIDEVAGMPGALPLLSFALSELYLKLVHRYLEVQNAGDTVERAITWADYDALGGVTKSLTQRADEIYEELVKVDPAYEKTIRNVMLRMVAVGGELARRQVPELELQYPEPENGRVQQVLSRFSTVRLLVSGTDADDKPYIEPAHDALVRGWEKLQEWVKENMETLTLQPRLTPQANDWYKNNQNTEYLWIRDPRLALLEKLLESKTDNWLNQLEMEFVRHSKQKRIDELEETKNQLRISEERRLAAEIELGSVMASRQFETERGLESLLLAMRMGRELQNWKNNNNPPLQSYPTVSPLFTLQTLLDNINEQNRLNISEDDATWEFLGYKVVEEVNLALSSNEFEETRRFDSPDQQHFVTLDTNGHFKIWELPNQLIQEPTEVENNNISDIIFSADGQLVITMYGSLYASYTVVFWNLSGYILGKFTPKPSYSVRELVLSKNSQHFALLEQIDGGAETQFLHFFEVVKNASKVIKIGEGGYRGYFGKMRFTEDGNYLITGTTPSHPVHYWNLKPRLQIKPSHIGWFSGEMLLEKEELEKDIYSSVRQNLYIEKLNGSKVRFHKGYIEILELENNPDWFEQAFLTFTEKIIATVGNDGTVRFWTLSGKKINRLKEIRLKFYQSGNQVIFSRDGHYIAVMQNNSISIQNLLTQKTIGNIAGDKFSFSSSVSFSPNGQRIATVGSERTVRLWDLRGRQLAELNLTNPQVTSILGTHFDTGDGTDPVIGFSSDGKNVIIAVGEGQNIPLFWEVEELEDLLKRGCQWMHDYLSNPRTNISTEERQLCKYNKTSQT